MGADRFAFVVDADNARSRRGCRGQGGDGGGDRVIRFFACTDMQ